MPAMLQYVSTLCTGLFAGAALYINLAEHPARMRLDPLQALAQWAPSYQRATLMQAPLALLACLTASAAAWSGDGPGWWFVAILIGTVVPFTFLAIMPTNRRLLALDRMEEPELIRTLLQRWSRLHAVRTALSLVAMLLSLRLLSA